jgi:hypothetical protein
MQTRYKVCWYASIFIVNQKYVQMRFYLYFTNTEDFFVTISMFLTKQCIQLKNILFCIKKCFLFEFITKTLIQPSFQIFSYDTKLRRHFQAILACLRKFHFQFKYRLFYKLFFMKICKRSFSIFLCSF